MPSQTRFSRRAAPALTALAVAALAPLVACESGAAHRASSSTPTPPTPPRIAPGQPAAVGLMTYTVDRVSATRAIARRPAPLAAPPGEVFVVVEYRRRWNGSNPLTAPAAPFELVTAAGGRLRPDLDAMGAHLLATNCGDLGPTRIEPGGTERTCVVFRAPEAALRGARLEPTAADHRGLARPVIDLGEVPLGS